MTKFHAPHPAGEKLLKFADGELSPKQAAAVRSHLEACWNCRTQLEEFQKGIADYVRFHEAFKTEAPAPPGPWADLRRRMEEEDRALAGPAVRRTPSRRWLSAAAAILLACLAFYRFGSAPKASAAVLLRKAVAAEIAAPAGPRHIRVRMRDRSFVRPAVYARDAGPDSLAGLFASAHYNWEEPLSARSYASWRDQLSEKRDEVETVRQGASSLYRIRTTTPAGALAEATITLRANDFAPVSGSFQFRGSEWVEITEAPAPLPEPDPAAPAREVARAMRPPEPAVPAARAAPGPSEELGAIAALHEIGADLGEPIEVTRTDRGLVVTGTGIDQRRQEQVKASLARVPRVQLRFEEPRPMTAQESSAREPLSVAAPKTAFGAELEKSVGGRIALEKLTNRALDLSEAAMARAHALRNLARRFPASEEARLSESDLETLATLRREHAEALAGSAAELAAMLNGALTALGAAGASRRDAPALAANWQEAAAQVFTATQEADRLLSALLAGANTTLAPDQVVPRLATALQRLQALAAAYRDAFGTGEGRR